MGKDRERREKKKYIQRKRDGKTLNEDRKRDRKTDTEVILRRQRQKLH